MVEVLALYSSLIVGHKVSAKRRYGRAFGHSKPAKASRFLIIMGCHVTQALSMKLNAKGSGTDRSNATGAHVSGQ